MAVRWLEPDEYDAWRAYRRMRALLDLEITRDLAAHGLSDADYDVLTTLSGQDGARMRIGELASRMLWTQSRLSHHLTRMAGRGLVERTAAAGDDRGAVVVLTDHGWTVLRTAAPSHVQCVRENFIDLMSVGQLKALATVAHRVVDRLGR
jgi:DNA-binding MarR family transcriptional regulator